MSIKSRRISRLFEVDDGLVLAGSGCWSDIQALAGNLIIIIYIL
jgi:20S proteasome alpha/beta subunit